MIWLLMQRLAFKLPTALQLCEGHAILFHEGGTSSFLHPTGVNRYIGLSHDEPSGRIWALIDSSQLLSVPAPIFRAGKPFFVVQAASRQDCFEWANKVHRQNFYVKTWAFSEILQVYVVLPPEVHSTHGICRRSFLGIECGGPHQESQLRYLYDTYRAPLRELAWYANEPRLYENRITQKVDENLPHVLRAALSSPNSDDSSHLIVRMEPDSDRRGRYRKTIASRYILELLWERHLKDSTDEMARLYTALQGSAVTAPAVGGILELRLHQLFTSREYPLRLFPLLQSKSNSAKFHLYDNYSASYKEENLKLPKLTVSEVLPLDKGKIQLQIDHYYRPTADNYPSVDSLLLIRPTNGGNPSPILLMFQIARNKEDHDVKEVGLERVEELGLPPDTRKYYVVVTPLDKQPRILVPKAYHGKMDVFYHPVDRLFSGTTKRGVPIVGMGQ